MYVAAKSPARAEAVTLPLERVAAQRAIRSALAGRRLVWFGIRGEDGDALRWLPELDGAFSIIAPLTGVETEACLERLSGQRPDLDHYDLDLDRGEAADELRSSFLGSLRDECVVMPYRPSALVSGLSFSMEGRVTVAGLLQQHQAMFENKPWVERELARAGVRGLGWRYVPDDRRGEVRALVAERGRHVLRTSRCSGGVGIALAESPEDVDRLWPAQRDAFVAVAPFQEGVPVNLSGCLFGDGSVRLHPPSLQLIGLHECTDRPFGYCGNDFGAVSAAFGVTALERLEQLARTVARWLHGQRYRGAFGIDALIAGDEVLFTEVNPRFQGSSPLSAAAAEAVGVADLFTDHLGALLGLVPERGGVTLREWAERQPALSRVVVHNLAGQSVRRDAAAPLPKLPAGAWTTQLAESRTAVAPGAVLGALTLPRSVTTTGFHVDDATASAAATLRRAFEPDGAASSTRARAARPAAAR
jgi:hypothetical protein